MRNSVLAAAVVAGALLLSGCATAPQTTQQRLYALQAGYVEAVKQMADYEARPRCGSDGADPLTCSDAGIVKDMRAADDMAYLALVTAKQQPSTDNVDTLEADLRAFSALLVKGLSK